MLHSKEQIDLCKYRLTKAKEYLQDAQATLSMGMFDTAANRSYYAIFHAIRALLALDGIDFKKHAGVISYFQMEYIKTGLLDREMSDIVKSAFSLRQESDYEDFYVISHDEVRKQVEEAGLFYGNIKEFIETRI